MLDVHNDDQMTTISNLSPRRREALKWMAQGYSDEEIGQYMGLSSGTVISYNSMNFSILKLSNLPTMDAKRSTAMRLYRQWAEQHGETADAPPPPEENESSAEPGPHEPEAEEAESVVVEGPAPKYTIALSMPVSDPDKVVGAPRFVILEQQTSDQEAAALERSGYQLEAVTQFIVPDTLSVIGTAVYVRRRR